MSDVSNDDEFLFDDSTEAGPTRARDSWKIIIVDDEPAIHSVTKLAMKDCVFDGKGLEIISAFSGAEAREVIAAHPDAAMMLLDVVMETGTSAGTRGHH